MIFFGIVVLDVTNPVAYELAVISNIEVEEVEQTEVLVSDEVNALGASISWEDSWSGREARWLFLPLMFAE